MLGLGDSIRTVIIPIHKEGFPFIGISLLVTFFLFLLSSFTGFIGIILTCFVTYFFRNPPRFPTDDENAIVSAADGTVDQILECDPPEELNLTKSGNWVRVSTFLNIFNVHSQRIPFNGVVKKVLYHPGKFINVTNDKDCKDNERNSVVIETGNGSQIVFVQIAGMIARRIVNTLKEGDSVKKGDYYGLIRFGSRVDVYFPNTYKIVVKKGQTMIGGETILAYAK